MTIIAQIDIKGTPSDDPNDLIAVFVNGEVRGVSNPSTFISSLNARIALVQVFGNAGETFTFRYYDHSTDTELSAINAPITFEVNGTVGSPSNPVLVTANHYPTDISLSSNSIPEKPTDR